MNADPRLLELARQLGQLLQAYGGEALADPAARDGHALLEISAAFQDGATQPMTEPVAIDLPLFAGGDEDDFDLHADCIVRLMLAGNQLGIERLQPTDNLDSGLSHAIRTVVSLRRSGALVTEAFWDDFGQPCIRQLLDDRVKPT